MGKPPESPDKLALNKALSKYTQRIRAAISLLSENAPTSGRAVIDAYHRHLSPTLASREDTQLPFPVRRHRNVERMVATQASTTPYTLLCFHIGNAILAYYEAVQNKKLSDALEFRVRFLEAVAENGIESFRIGGKVGEGHYLYNKEVDANLKLLKNPVVSIMWPEVKPPKVRPGDENWDGETEHVQKPTQSQATGTANTGGGGSSGGTPVVQR